MGDKPTKLFPVLYRREPTGEPEHEFLEMEISEELAKLEKQVTDEKFLSKAPAAAIEKVKAKLAKVLSEIVVPVYVNRKLDDGDYEWELWYCNRIWVWYNAEGKTGRSRFGREFTFPDERSCQAAWTEVNEYWVSPDTWVRQIWEREQREYKEERRKLYLKLKEEFEPNG